MKRIALIAILLASSFAGNAQFLDFGLGVGRKENKPVKFEYDVDFWYYFDNREFTASTDLYMASATSHAVLATPYAGLSVQQGGNVNHRFMLGAEFCRYMGAGEKLADVPKEVLAFYDMHATGRRGRFEAVAGIFPRAFQEEDYSEAIYSGGLKFGDRNYEGCILKYGNERFYAELGLDWMGRYGYDVKERFQVFTAGHWDATPWLRLGWAAVMYHFAGSVIAPGVVDNHLLNPYVKLNFAKQTGLQELSLKAGGLLTYQWDRMHSDAVQFPGGGEFVLALRNWNVGIKDVLYAGKGIQPYYFDTDSSGEMYGSRLYMGNPFYRSGPYNMTEISYSPKITDYLRLDLMVRLYCGVYPEHTGSFGLAGNQEICSLIFDLDRILNPGRVCGRLGSPEPARKTQRRTRSGRFLSL